MLYGLCRKDVPEEDLIDVTGFDGRDSLQSRYERLVSSKTHGTLSTTPNL